MFSKDKKVFTLFEVCSKIMEGFYVKRECKNVRNTELDKNCFLLIKKRCSFLISLNSHKIKKN